MRRRSPKASPASTPRCASCSAPPGASTSSGDDPRALITPETWVRDYIQAQRNHYPELEERCETLGEALERPAVGVRTAAAAAEGGVGDRGPGRRRPRCSATSASITTRERRTVHDLGAAAARRTAPSASPTSWRCSSSRRCSSAWSTRPRRPTPAPAQLLHMSFANYAAGAIMMPYGRFLARRRGASLRDRPAVRRSSAPMSSRSRTG